jgi:deoxyribodipyrimidine photo-lyase
MHMHDTAVLWFRRDLRVDDHPALLAAAAPGRDVLGVFVVDDALMRPSGLSRRHFLAGSLAALDDALGGRLLIVHGRPDAVIPSLAAAVAAAEVHVSADYGPYGRRRDEVVGRALSEHNIALVATGSPYAVAPGRVRKPDGGRYSVFTPYWRAWAAHGWRSPAGSGDRVSWVDPRGLPGKHWKPSEMVSGQPGPTLPEPGERAAGRTWRQFMNDRVDDYDGDRNRPDLDRTSRMSPYLKWGAIHPRTLLADLAQRPSKGAASYRRELAWREFYADVLFHEPESARRSVDPTVDAMQWDHGANADELFEQWRLGRTGYPMVDAGMRQLLAEGWMHNRVRMIVASFLIKDLHLPWQRGARHFLAHLVDGDLASNNHGWQWVAGSGPQASQFSRVFNPVLQGHTFDPDGDYVRRHVAELREVEGGAVHQPWDLPGGPPSGYPDRLVDHNTERLVTLQRWADRPR